MPELPWNNVGLSTSEGLCKFAHVLLARIKPLLLENGRQQQRGFTSERFTSDRILTLNVLVQRRRGFRKPTYAASLDRHLKSAFDSLSRPALWLLLLNLGIPTKIWNLMAALYHNSSSCVHVSDELSEFFAFHYGVRHTCVLALDSFNTSVDWILDHTVSDLDVGVSLGHGCCFMDLDHADDVALLAELLDLLSTALLIC